jgi:hypothetical protein
MPTTPILDLLTQAQAKYESAQTAQQSLDVAKTDLEAAKAVVTDKQTVVDTARTALAGARGEAKEAFEGVIAQLQAIVDSLTD